MFTNAEKVDIRRFLGYPAYGGGASGFQSWRFFQAYGLIEFRLNNMAPEEETVTRTTYLANLYTLEDAVPNVTNNQDTDEAGIWKRNRTEMQERQNLFDGWRRRFCGFLGVPAGPALGDGGLSLVV